MYLPDERGAVPGGAQPGRDGRGLRAAPEGAEAAVGPGVVEHAVVVRELAGEDGSARGRAQGLRHVGAVEGAPVLADERGQTRHHRGGPEIQVVGEDEDDVGPARGRHGSGGGRGGGSAGRSAPARRKDPGKDEGYPTTRGQGGHLFLTAPGGTGAAGPAHSRPQGAQPHAAGAAHQQRHHARGGHGLTGREPKEPNDWTGSARSLPARLRDVNWSG